VASVPEIRTEFELEGRHAAGAKVGVAEGVGLPAGVAVGVDVASRVGTGVRVAVGLKVGIGVGTSRAQLGQGSQPAKPNSAHNPTTTGASAIKADFMQ
jgi:hypothetical protein